jgi:hypothetical protein
VSKSPSDEIVSDDLRWQAWMVIRACWSLRVGLVVQPCARQGDTSMMIFGSWAMTPANRYWRAVATSIDPHRQAHQD